MKRVFFVFFWFFLFSLSAFGFDRVVSLSPALTDIVAYVGAGKKLVGVTVFCSGSVCRGKERVGGIVNPNLEKIYSLHPDLVIATTMTPKRDVEALKRLGLKVLVFRLVSLEDVVNATGKLGELLSGGGEDKGRELLRRIREGALPLSRCLKGKRVVVVISSRPLYVAGSRSYLGEILEMAGAEVLPDTTFSAISYEALVRLKPDLVISVGRGKFHPPENFKVVRVEPSDDLLHPSPRILRGVEEIRRAVCGR